MTARRVGATSASAMQEQAVIDGFIEEGADRSLDGVEIGHHALRVEPGAAQRNAGSAVVAVQAAALPRMIEQAMAITERQLLGDAEHALIVAPAVLLC